jgi:hypothetical protein
MLVRFAIIEEVVAGGVDDLEPEAAAPPTSCVMIEDSRRVEVLSGLTVLVEGEGGVAVSNDTAVGAVIPRFKARYDR